jgi:hypothetical protein
MTIVGKRVTPWLQKYRDRQAGVLGVCGVGESDLPSIPAENPVIERQTPTQTPQLARCLVTQTWQPQTPPNTTADSGVWNSEPQKPADSLAFPRAPTPQTHQTPAVDDEMAAEFGERAAIVEFGADVSREWAEAFALLLAATRPIDINEARWQLFLDDVGRLLDGGWTPKLVEAGWTTVDVLGVHRRRPSVRLDAMGAGWFIKGGKVAAVHRDIIVVEGPTGECHTIRRRTSIDPPVLPSTVINKTS